MTKSAFLGVGALTVHAIAQVAVAAGGFHYLPSSNGATPLVAISISFDGTRVTGEAVVADDGVPFVWSERDGLQTLTLPAGSHDGIGWGISEDGSTVVGDFNAGRPECQAFRWNATEGFHPMCNPAQGYSTAFGVSGDGRIIVGADVDRSRGFRWTSQTGSLYCGFNEATDINRAGNAITGSPPGRLLNGIMTSIPLLPGATVGYGFGLSDDGRTVVGTMYGGGGDRAFIWTESEGLSVIADAQGVAMHAASAVSADGSVVVGWGPTATGLYVWTRQQGVRDLSEVVDGPVPPIMWVPEIRDISGNGRVVVGSDYDGAFVATIAVHCTSDFDGDGQSGTGADVEAFFACIAGNCCLNCASADFNGDGDYATDADIESFFRVLSGGPC